MIASILFECRFVPETELHFGPELEGTRILRVPPLMHEKGQDRSVHLYLLSHQLQGGVNALRLRTRQLACAMQPGVHPPQLLNEA